MWKATANYKLINVARVRALCCTRLVLSASSESAVSAGRQRLLKKLKSAYALSAISMRQCGWRLLAFKDMAMRQAGIMWQRYRQENR